jgi:hypothetical protein
MAYTDKEKAAYNAKYYAEHKKEDNVRSRQYHKDHKEEIRAYSAEYYATHKEENAVRCRRNALERRYGLATADYDRMFADQNGVCAICGHSPNGRKLDVDHDHLTDRIRGLLCSSCNIMLGGANDSQDTLAKAIEYLRQS